MKTDMGDALLGNYLTITTERGNKVFAHVDVEDILVEAYEAGWKDCQLAMLREMKEIPVD